MLNFGWLKRNKGQGMVEYILIVIVVVGLVLVGYKFFGKQVKGAFQEGGNKITQESTDAYNNQNDYADKK